MQPAKFKLITFNDRATLIMPGTDLQVSIYNLADERFYPDADRMQLYVHDGITDPLAFEFNLVIDQLEDIGEAIRWYTHRLANADADPVFELARPPHPLVLVR